jgi:hypothetical protein
VLNALLVFFIGWNVLLAAALLLALTAAAFLLRRRLPPAATPWPALPAGDARFLLALAGLVLVFVAVPLSRNPTVEGDDGSHAYHSLMAHDYLMRGTFAVSVRHGLPPRDAFLASERMHNSCLYYALVAFAMETTDGTWAPERFVAATDLVLPFLFLLALFAACRAVLPGRWPWVAVLLGLVAYSFNDLFVFTKYVRWSGIDRLHDFAAEFSDLSHGWTRDFLVEPHAVLALAFGFTAFALSAHAIRTRAARHPSVAIGILVAGAFASDGFLGTLFVLFFGVTVLGRWIRRRAEGWVPGPAAWLGMGLSFAIPAGAALATGLASAGTPTGGLALRPYMTALKFGVALFPLVLGPALLFALGFLARGARASLRGWGTLGVLAGLCLFAALFVQHTDPDFADLVLRKSMKVMRLPVVLLAAGGLAWWLRPGLAVPTLRRRRWIVGALALVAVPTLAVDGATLAGLHPGVRTSTVTRAELDACAWIRAHTPQDAVVQSLPESRDGYYALSPVAMFAGRAMALGNRKMARLSSPSGAAFEAVATDVDHLFRSLDPDRARRLMQERGIDYVLVGPREQEAYGIGTHKFAMLPDVFETVYDRSGIRIVRLR